MRRAAMAAVCLAWPALWTGTAPAQVSSPQPAAAPAQGSPLQPAAAPAQGSPLQPAAAPLDYSFFKSRVEPIFLKKRAGHARCYVCHADSNNAFRLERIPAGRTFWTEEQSRRNFETVSALAGGGDAGQARLLLHPLAPEGGGDAFHSGGRQFKSRNDPDWKTLAQWVSGGR